jgi:hypothetical protein
MGISQANEDRHYLLLNILHGVIRENIQQMLYFVLLFKFWLSAQMPLLHFGTSCFVPSTRFRVDMLDAKEDDHRDCAKVHSNERRTGESPAGAAFSFGTFTLTAIRPHWTISPAGCPIGAGMLRTKAVLAHHSPHLGWVPHLAQRNFFQ